MKNILIIGLLLAAMLSMTGCLFEEKELFEESAAIRSSKAIAEIKDILVNAENGWILEYYPDTASYGGFQLLVSFDKSGRVVFSADSRLRVGTKDKKESAYDVIADQGPVLTFNTCNAILHRFSNPENSSGTGLNGDYEFVVMKHTDDQLNLKGKKHGMKLVMKKMATDITWEAYLEKLNKVVAAIDYPYMNLQVAGVTVDNIYTGSVGRFLDFYRMESNKSKHYTGPFIVTPQGIDFYKPFEINGVTVSSLTYDETAGNLRGTDSNGGSVIMSAYKLEPNALFRESRDIWVMDKKYLSDDMLGFYERIEKSAPNFNDEENSFELYFIYYTHYIDNTTNDYRMVSLIGKYLGVHTLDVRLINNYPDRIAFRQISANSNVSFFNTMDGYSQLFSGIMKNGTKQYTVTLDEPTWPSEVTLTSIGANSGSVITLFNQGQILNLIKDADKIRE